MINYNIGTRGIIMSKNPFKTEKSEEKTQEIQEDIKEQESEKAEEIKTDEPSEYDKLNQ